jgi:hypothetical protein
MLTPCCCRYAGWLQPSQGAGYASQQSGARVMPSSVPVDDDRLWVPVPANIALSRARGWSFEDCRLYHCFIIVIVIIVIIVIIIIIIHHHSSSSSSSSLCPF